MRRRASKTGLKNDLTDVAKEIIDIVTGKSSPEQPATRSPDAGALSKLGATKGNLSAKRRRSLLVQIEAATGVRKEIAGNARSKQRQ